MSDGKAKIGEVVQAAVSAGIHVKLSVGSPEEIKTGANHYVYIYYTYRDSQSYTHGHIRRYTATGSTGTNPFDLFDVTSSAPGTIYHNGGYIKFGPDGKLYAKSASSTKTNNHRKCHQQTARCSG